MTHAFNLSTGKLRQADLCEFTASLVYIVSSRLAKVYGFCLKKQTKDNLNDGVLVPEFKMHQFQISLKLVEFLFILFYALEGREKFSLAFRLY